jgi:hypothetical protein
MKLILTSLSNDLSHVKEDALPENLTEKQNKQKAKIINLLA